MARPGITFEQVAQAADALLAAGKNPTINAVREALGGTGSPNTVHRHLTAWRGARPQAQAAAHELPAELVNSFGKELAKAAASARAEIEAQLVQAQSEAAELSATGETLEAQLADIAEQLAGVATERDSATATAAERAAEIERQAQTIQREQQAAEAARVELAKSQLKIEGLAEKLSDQAIEIGRLRDALDAADKARQEATQSAAVLASEIRGAERRATEAEAREGVALAAREAIDKQINAAKLAEQQARIAEQAVQARLDATVREIEQAKKATAEARAEAKTSGEIAAELRGKLAAIETQGAK